MHFSRYLSLIIFSAVLVTAQTDHTPSDAKVVHLDDLIVSASPYAKSQTELAQPTHVLTGAKLSLQQSTTLGELLSSEPGVSSTYFGPGASRPIIRGMSGDRLKILENSSGTIDASVTSPDHAVSLDPLLIERVEIVRGPAALLYGSNAVAGAINIITHRIHTAPAEHRMEGRVELRTQSVNNEESAGIVLEGGAGSFAWHLDGFSRKSKDLTIPGYAESESRRAAEEAEHHDEEGDEEHEEHEEEAEAYGTLPNTSIQADGGAIGFTFLGDWGTAGFSFNGYNTLYGVPAGAHSHEEHEHEEDEHEDHEEEEAHEEESVRIDLVQRRFDFQSEITHDFGIFEGAKIKLSSSQYRHQELEGTEIGTVFRNQGFDARVELLHRPIANFTGAIGWQSGSSDFEAIGAEAFVPPSRTQTHALFIFEEREFGALTWQLGGRGEMQTVDLQDGSQSSLSDEMLSISSGLVWKFSDPWSLGVSAARTERAPNAQERFANGAHIGTQAYEIGDPNLGLETSHAIDLTLRKRAGFVTGSLTVFHHQFDGFIYEQPTGLFAVEHEGVLEFVAADDPEAEEGLAIYRYVQHDAQFQGAELEVTFHLHDNDHSQLDLTLGGDFVRAEDQKSNINLPRITPPRTKVGLQWARDSLVIGSEVQFVGAQNRTAPGETKTDGYQLISASLTYRIPFGNQSLTLFARGTNLANQEARAHPSFLKDVAPLPGRNLNLGLRLSF
jgi:iron complex outermembrane recepter protein